MGLQYLNNYRAIAILLVVLSHAASIFPDTESPFILALNPVFGTGTLLFVLVGGQFFGVMSSSFEYGNFIRGKFKFVLLPYVVVSLPAALIYVLGLKGGHQWVDMAWFSSLDAFEKYVYLLLTGAHLGPLWFVPMIFCYYLASPLWSWLIKVDGLIFPIVLGVILATYLGRPSGNSDALRAFLYFLPVYLMGVYVALNPWVSDLFSKRPTFGFLCSSILLMVVGPIELCGITTKLIFGLLAACYLMAILKRSLNKKVKLLDLLARLSFYIFFVHGYVAGLFRYAFKGYVPSQWDAFFVLLIFFIMLILCILLYVPLKYWLGDKSKYLIGG